MSDRLYNKKTHPLWQDVNFTPPWLFELYQERAQAGSAARPALAPGAPSQAVQPQPHTALSQLGRPPLPNGLHHHHPGAPSSQAHPALGAPGGGQQHCGNGADFSARLMSSKLDLLALYLVSGAAEADGVDPMDIGLATDRTPTQLRQRWRAELEPWWSTLPEAQQAQLVAAARANAQRLGFANRPQHTAAAAAAAAAQQRSGGAAGTSGAAATGVGGGGGTDTGDDSRGGGGTSQGAGASDQSPGSTRAMPRATPPRTRGSSQAGEQQALQ